MVGKQCCPALVNSRSFPLLGLHVQLHIQLKTQEYPPDSWSSFSVQLPPLWSSPGGPSPSVSLKSRLCLLSAAALGSRLLGLQSRRRLQAGTWHGCGAPPTCCPPLSVLSWTASQYRVDRLSVCSDPRDGGAWWKSGASARYQAASGRCAVPGGLPAGAV